MCFNISSLTILLANCCVKSRAENEIDGEAFLLLSNEDVKDLVKLVGPRTKLLKKRCQLLKQDEPWSPPVPQVTIGCI